MDTIRNVKSFWAPSASKCACAHSACIEHTYAHTYMASHLHYTHTDTEWISARLHLNLETFTTTKKSAIIRILTGKLQNRENAIVNSSNAIAFLLPFSMCIQTQERAVPIYTLHIRKLNLSCCAGEGVGVCVCVLVWMFHFSRCIIVFVKLDVNFKLYSFLSIVLWWIAVYMWNGRFRSPAVPLERTQMRIFFGAKYVI